MLCFAETSEKKDRPPPPPPRRSSLASSISTVPSLPKSPPPSAHGVSMRSSLRRSGRQRRSRRLSCLSNCERQAEVVVANAEQVKRRVLASLHVRSCSIARCENLDRTFTKPQVDVIRATSPEVSQGTARPASCMAITESGRSTGSNQTPATNNSTTADNGGLTVQELRQISSRQQRHIEIQRRRLTEKTARLQQLRRKEAVRKKTIEGDDTSAKLRAKIEDHEIKIKQAKATRMQVNEFKFSNENMAMELDSLRTTFAEKQRELSRYNQRVEELKVALEHLRSNTATTFGHRTSTICSPTLSKPPNKVPTPAIIQAVNDEFKAKFGGITETDDAKEMTRKLDDKWRDSNRLDEQLALMRTRLGLQNYKKPERPVPPPPPVRSTSPLRRNKAMLPDASRNVLSMSLEHMKSPESKIGANSGEYVHSALFDRNRGRYAPRAVIADTYMRRMRTSRSPPSHINTSRLDELRKGVHQPIEPQPTDSEKLAKPDLKEEPNKQLVVTPTKGEDANNNDSGHGLSITSSVPSVGGNDNLDDDVFAGGPPVPPPAAFDGDESTSTSTPVNNDISSDSLSSPTDPKPCEPPDASIKPKKSCLKASCDTVLYATSRPNFLFDKEKQTIPYADSMTPTGNGLKQSVSFDPLALMLDAAMEGELALVKQTAQQVKDVSAGNDEGSTALHNSICSGHDEVSNFLVTEAAADVNSVDIDGWTALHCAASCGNLPMCKLLVEYGAAVFLCTNGDEETAVEKCDEDDDAGQRTADYLFGVQQQLGVANDGVVYAVFPYRAKNKDELSFDVNEELTVLKKGDAAEIEWYWARNKKGVIGYIPRNFLALHRRFIREKRPLSSPTDEAKSPTAEVSDDAWSKKPAERDDKSDKTAF